MSTPTATTSNLPTITPDDFNDWIRAHLTRTMPFPKHGFDSAASYDEWRWQRDREFLRIQALPVKEILALVQS